MSDQEFEDYLRILNRLLRLNRSQRTAIACELRDHLQERLSNLTGQGVPQEEAIAMVLEEFGDAALLAARFTEVTRKRRRRWIMRWTIGSVAVMAAALLLALAYWPESRVTTVGRLVNADEGAVKQSVKESSAEEAANAEVAAKLARPIQAQFQDSPLGDVIDYFTDAAGVQIYVKWKRLGDVGVTKDAPVTMNLKNVPADFLLQLVLEQIDDSLSYTTQKGIVLITAREELENQTSARVYNVRDLLMKQKDGASDDYDSLIDMLTCTVAPTTWDQVGGPGSIAPYNGLLVVSQTTAVHAEVEKMLRLVREATANPAATSAAPGKPGRY